jgi:hypothetical protein
MINAERSDHLRSDFALDSSFRSLRITMTWYWFQVDTV